MKSDDGWERPSGLDAVGQNDHELALLAAGKDAVENVSAFALKEKSERKQTLRHNPIIHRKRLLSIDADPGLLGRDAPLMAVIRNGLESSGGA
ncbi:MAG: hypothetical protein HC850_08100 [Rhodomicrobium sp.]|nr:hypothetical protein [Rhodomicrobium sp.]